MVGLHLIVWADFSVAESLCGGVSAVFPGDMHYSVFGAATVVDGGCGGDQRSAAGGVDA